jgi:hypothetical protein
MVNNYFLPPCPYALKQNTCHSLVNPGPLSMLGGPGGGGGGGRGGGRGKQRRAVHSGEGKPGSRGPTALAKEKPRELPKFGGEGVGRHEIRGDAEKANVCGKRGF